MDKVTRGEKLLDRFQEDGVVSECGKDWMIAAIDPFHDHQLQHLAGWPDADTGASVVRCIKQSVTFTKPVALTPGLNWDCHIIQWPWLTQSRTGVLAGTTVLTNKRRANTMSILPAPAPFSQVGGLQVYATDAGNDLNILQGAYVNGADTFPLNVQAAHLEIDPAYTQGSGRLLGLGFEVHNTTSVLNVQGAVCCYRMMANSLTPSTYNLNFAPSVSVFSGNLVRHPPLNTAEALLLSGTRQWEAKDGCYVVGAFTGDENPAMPCPAVSPVILYPSANDPDAEIANDPLFVTVPFSFTSGTPIDYAQVPQRSHPIQQSGAIFTGLSPSTTLTLNWNVYYESFPNQAQVDILPLATPSCEYDPDAMDLYSRIMIDLPVGVMVRENGMGDWFFDAASKAAEFVGPYLEMIPHPLAKAAGATLGAVGKSAQKYLNEGKRTPENTWVTETEDLAKNKSIKKKQPAKLLEGKGTGKSNGNIGSAPSRKARRKANRAKKSGPNPQAKK